MQLRSNKDFVSLHNIILLYFRRCSVETLRGPCAQLSSVHCILPVDPVLSIPLTNHCSGTGDHTLCLPLLGFFAHAAV